MSLTRGLTTDVIVLKKRLDRTQKLEKSKMVKEFVKVCLQSTQAEEISLQFEENMLEMSHLHPDLTSHFNNEPNLLDDLLPNFATNNIGNG